jgi:hypothetical protein
MGTQIVFSGAIAAITKGLPEGSPSLLADSLRPTSTRFPYQNAMQRTSYSSHAPVDIVLRWPSDLARCSSPRCTAWVISMRVVENRCVMAAIPASYACSNSCGLWSASADVDSVSVGTLSSCAAFRMPTGLSLALRSPDSSANRELPKSPLTQPG